MTTLIKQRVVWTGTGVIGGGLSVFYFDVATSGTTAAIKAWFATVMQIVPVGTSAQVENAGDTIDDATGAIVGTWSDGSTQTIPGTGTGVWAAGVGLRVSWLTGGVTNGRRVRGSTFLVPMNAASYGSDGTIDNAVLGAQNTAAQTFQTTMSSSHRIWTRPVDGAGGRSHPVTGVIVPDRISWLRSRRV